MSTRTVLMCVGTRPEIIKMAPVYHALRYRHALEVVLLHTGQHDVLAEDMYAFFNMQPDYRFQFKRQSHTLNHLFAMILDNLDHMFDEIAPEVVLVQGDTTSALAGAMCGFYRHCRVGHVEAGLRTYDDYAPYPEEKNRELISRLAHWHFSPTARATQNLLDERVPPEQVYEVGNTIVDAVNWTRLHLRASDRDATASLEPVLHGLDENNNHRRLVLVTAHRRESWDGRIAGIAKAVAEAAARFPDLQFIWPVHPNPVVKKAVYDTLRCLDDDSRERVYLCDPLGYPTLVWLLQHAWLVLTDSGGIQEEALSLSTPVLVLRDKTERPEVIDAHGGMLVGTQVADILAAVASLHDDADTYASFKCDNNPFGDGRSAERISEILLEQLAIKTD